MDYDKKESSSPKKTCLIVAIVVLVLLGIGSLVTFSWYKNGYDTAVAKHEAVSSSWAQVENVLQRRYDLIPNLVETVKGYAKHEKELFEKIAEYRTQYFSAKGPAAKAKAAGQLEGVLSRLLFLQEKYPDLKANESFLKLQDELAGTENRISVERRRYNEAVRGIKTYSRTFFGSWFCQRAGVTTDDIVYFKAEEGAKKAPKVKF